MVAELTILTHKIAIQLYLVAESYTICGSRSRRPVRKLLNTPSYLYTKIQTRSSSDSLVITIKPLAKYKFRTVAILFCILQKQFIIKVAYF
jgi:hypothetical protein